MNGIYVLLGLVIGICLGWFLRGKGKEKRIYTPVYLLSDVVSWICAGDRDRTMHDIVHKVYQGTRHLHANPPSKKVKSIMKKEEGKK